MESGGGGGNTPTITTLSPSNIVVGVPLGTLLVTGSNFKSDALVAIDGQEVSTFMLDPHTLEGEVSPDFDNRVATHKITVQQSTGTSNAVSMAVYAPQQGPFVMNAVPGFLVGTESNPPWIAVADVNGVGHFHTSISSRPTTGRFCVERFGFVVVARKIPAGKPAG